MLNKYLKNFGAFLFLYLVCTPTFAYIGPGAGLSAIGTFLGLILATIVAFFAFIYFPLKKRRNKKLAAQDEE